MASTLAQLAVQLLQIILPFIIFIGVLGNSLNIAVLTRPALFRHACSRYFLALATNNLLYSSVFLLNSLFANGYQLSLSKVSLSACKVMTYLSTLNAFLSPYFIVFASIDRFCASSVNVRIRNLSNIRTTKWTIFTIVFFYSLFFINILVMTTLQTNQGLNCSVQANTIYRQIYIFVQVSLFAIFPPILMFSFGLLTIRNTKRIRVAPIAASNFYRTERQLAQMLFLQVGTHIFLTLPTSVTYLISALPNDIRTTTIFSFVSTIAQLLFNLSYTTPFFSYLLSGRVYRRELIRLIYAVLHIRYTNQIQPTDFQTTVQVL